MTGSIATIGYALATLGPSIGIGMLVSKTQDALARQPEVRKPLFLNMMLSIAFVEALGLLGFVAGFMF